MRKRALDIILSSFLLISLSPLMLVVLVLVWVSDWHDPFFFQRRVGLHGSLFSMIKIRSMVPDAEAHLAELMELNERHGPLFKIENDPRVTPIGRLIRRLNIDELPQLINVLAGQMSLVGPRPAVPSEVVQFSPDLRRREQVLPGITGLWQVHGHHDPSFELYEELDLFYVDNWSLKLDLQILFDTVKLSFRRS
jgi:lipopolysaccharide/colanic/teichoic acid biosynthesis glycosyltransferase